jgi:NTE family protein
MDRQKIKFGVALGGGGSRAMTHLGVLTVLQDAGIRIDAVAGSSMGAILGAMYAFQPDAAEVKRQAFRYFAGSSLFGLTPKPPKNDGLQPRYGLWGGIKKYVRTVTISNIISFRKSLLRKNQAHQAIDDLLPDADIEDAQIPFACNALNLTDAMLETFTTGKLRPAVKAGTAVGVVFPPYHHAGKVYVDAAPVASVPVEACRRLGAEVVLAVDIRTPVPVPMAIQNGFDVISRVEMIESNLINSREAAQADFLLRPEVGDVFWGDFTRLEGVIAAGEKAASEMLGEIKAALAR